MYGKNVALAYDLRANMLFTSEFTHVTLGVGFGLWVTAVRLVMLHVYSI
jgi:hypothetical protein